MYERDGCGRSGDTKMVTIIKWITNSNDDRYCHRIFNKFSDQVRVFVSRKERTQPILTALINMPVSEMV